ncbi:phosphatidylserine decarboxylase [Campylobacter sp. MIT 99-7217]|uniref:phosphatidylserine decarboxylase n=1 Tax=Campylobacter sp. MIT 99-7217 TaxID=535091 RepID=UPI001159BE7F|nr:phosphatidylserine decarboxylase [Campylobacter sp. MIT 99-7217]TQR34723.1 phosphatidylserine decarboxylase [Campylobacter sp. MIT 99-7217]
MAFSNLVSRIFGSVASVSFPSSLQAKINEAYVRHFRIDLDEFDEAKNYISLNALFTRKLLKPRKLDEGFISPSDGKILQCGISKSLENEHFALAIKGFTYSINELLSTALDEGKREFGYINIYLSPKDYHRYHAPCDIEILSVHYVSGALFSVDEKHLLKIANLYTRNERFILKCKHNQKIFFLVFVGALNVGKMNFHFDESLKFKAKSGTNFSKNYENLHIKKGEELGYFELGSTIVVIFDKKDLKLRVSSQDIVKYGQCIAEL